MQAFVITEPEHYEFQERERPAPGLGEVLLEVAYVGLCGSDLGTWRGTFPMVTYPRLPGHELSGVIVERGAQVPAEWSVGLPVTVLPYEHCGHCTACRGGRTNACRSNQTMGVQREGGLTQFLAVPYGKLYSSTTLSLPELALVEPLSVGFHATERGVVTAEDRVLVLGCGAVGLGAVAAAAYRGAEVLAADVDERKLEIARKLGAAHTLHAGEVDIVPRVLELTGEEGVGVAIEAVGRPETYVQAVEAAAFCGRVVFIGYAQEPVAFETKLFVSKELDLFGSRNSLGDFPGVLAMLESGARDFVAMITRVYPFAEAGRALADWSADPAAFTKVLIELPR